jgi:hypothetical protein
MERYLWFRPRRPVVRTVNDPDIDLDRVLFDPEYRRRVVERLNEKNGAANHPAAPDPQPGAPARRAQAA